MAQAAAAGLLLLALLEQEAQPVMAATAQHHLFLAHP
jgi:hypothetical protein